MGIFKIFSKKKEVSSKWHSLTIVKLTKISNDTTVVTLGVPEDLKETFKFIAGQYLTLAVELQGKEERRSYSICSGVNEELSVAVKKVKDGKVSTYLNDLAKVGDQLEVMAPEGNFTISNEKTSVVFAAGSGITPIISILKNGGAGLKTHLFYGNKTSQDILFKEFLDGQAQVISTHYLSQEQGTGHKAGRLDRTAIMHEIKQNLDLLKADVFLLCGPEEMIKDALDALQFFGVSKEKIKYELFTTPVLLATKEAESDFNGESKVTVTLDHETFSFNMKSKGKTILEVVENQGYDAPFSCRGGVCCSCKAKVTEGKAVMKMNYSLSDKEVEEGYILTCQATPASAEITISYDL